MLEPLERSPPLRSKHKNRTINPMKLRLQSTINVEDQDMANFYASILTREGF